jgi:outer membrane protein assembly factor BamB
VTAGDSKAAVRGEAKMKSRLAVSAVVVAAAVLLLGGVCGRRLDPPEFVSIPSDVLAGDTAMIRLATSGRGYHSVRYIVNWDDASIETTELYALADTADIWHVWTIAPDTKYVRAAAYAPEDTQGIEWTAQRMVFVDVGGSHAPVIDTAFTNQEAAVLNFPLVFTVHAHDPYDDSLRLKFQWGPAETTTVNAASPCSVTVSHIFTWTDTAEVIISVQDTRGALSQPDTILVPVGLSGGVTWHWQSPVEDGSFNTSPLCVYDGEVECISAGCYWDESFYSLTARDGKINRRAQPMRSPYVFTGQPAFCSVTQHYIVGSEEGELYALVPDLACAWRWPDAPTESLEPMVLFGAPAIRDNRLYVPRDDDSLYYFVDSTDHCVRVATFPAGAGITCGPVIDAQGSVYFGTDSGYLHKVSPDLDILLWRTQPIAGGDVSSLIVGDKGNLYCTGGSSRLYAVDPATGNLLWLVPTEGRCSRVAAATSAIFFGTDLGVVYSINQSTGTVNWQKTLAQGARFVTSPVVAANGYLYLQDENDVLYCLRQLDGTLIWVCDCDSYLPGGGIRGKSLASKKTGFPHYDPDPTITSTGDVVVPGHSAVFCVVGYPEGQLDPLAPWPKWQHDLHNSGCVGGGVR